MSDNNTNNYNNNTNDRESAAEFVATVRNEHLKMKEWYNNNNNNEELQELHAKYGNKYPDLWKEVLNWSGYKDTRKIYLKYLDNNNTNNNNSDGNKNKQKKRKKSRWGTSNDNNDNNTNNKKQNTNNQQQQRWGNENTTTNTNYYGPNTTTTTNNNNNNSIKIPTIVLPGIDTSNSEIISLQNELRKINNILSNVEQKAIEIDKLPRDHPNRSPSPPPIYGADGKRQNTRAVRWKEKYTQQRQEILEKLLTKNKITNSITNNNVMSSSTNINNPLLLTRKKIKKINIPVDKYPNYNFIGLIIGPRGKTQKELEAKTGCKIAIRGKGSVKEGSRNKSNNNLNDIEPLHVVISGDDPKAVDAAATMINDMLIVIDDEKNVHKQQQLRELALLNGTLKDADDAASTFCPICAEKGHRAYECPNKKFNTNTNKLVKCAICGDTSHPTRDCKKQTLNNNNNNPDIVDQDYQNFMAELDGSNTNNNNNNLKSTANTTTMAQSTTTTTTATANNNTVLPPPPPPAGSTSSVPLPPPPPPGIGNNTNLPPVPPLPPPSIGVGVTLPPPPPLPPHMQQQTPAPGVTTSNIPGYNNNSSNNNYYGQQQQPPAPYQQQQQQQQHVPPYQQQQQQQYQQQQQPYYQQQQQQQNYQVVQPGQETATWDPNAYYNSTNNNNGGAGGLNWWEQ